MQVAEVEVMPQSSNGIPSDRTRNLYDEINVLIPTLLGYDSLLDNKLRFLRGLKHSLYGLDLARSGLQKWIIARNLASSYLTASCYLSVRTRPQWGNEVPPQTRLRSGRTSFFEEVQGL